MSLLYRIASFTREKVDEVLDAHLELLSVVVCTIIWAVSYGWIEANAIGPFQVLYHDRYGHLPWWLQLVWWDHLGFYQLIFFVMSSAITFSFGLLKAHRMWRHKKRYFLFTSLGAFPFSWMVEDISYFIFIDPKLDTLGPEDWTNWVFGGFQAGRLWMPTWWIITTTLSFSLFFLAYRSALYNLLLERDIERQLETAPTQPGNQEEPLFHPEAPPPHLTELTQVTQVRQEPEPAEEAHPEAPEDVRAELRRKLLVKKELEKG